MLAPGRQRPICIEAIHALLEPHGNPCNGRRWLYRQPYGLWTGRCRRERVVVLDNLSTGFDWAVAKGVPLIVGDTGDSSACWLLLLSTYELPESEIAGHWMKIAIVVEQ